MQPPEPRPDSILAALVGLAIGTMPPAYQQAAMVLAGSIYGGFLSLQRAAPPNFICVIWHLVQCVLLAFFLTDIVVAAAVAEMPHTWVIPANALLGASGLAIAWSWPDRAKVLADVVWDALKAALVMVISKGAERIGAMLDKRPPPNDGEPPK